MTTYLTQEQVDKLDVGTHVFVTWSGGNGPWEYVIVRRDDTTYAALPQDINVRHPLDLVGKHPLTQVWLDNPG